MSGAHGSRPSEEIILRGRLADALETLEAGELQGEAYHAAVSEAWADYYREVGVGCARCGTRTYPPERDATPLCDECAPDVRAMVAEREARP